MKGKEKCRILKDIRTRIAEDNDIEFVTKECEYQGDCKGTCPKCDSELRYLEEQLERKRKLGKGIAAAALTATMLVSTTACVPTIVPGAEPADPDEIYTEQVPEGSVPYEEPQEEYIEEPTMGEPVSDYNDFYIEGGIPDVVEDEACQTDEEPKVRHFDIEEFLDGDSGGEDYYDQNSLPTTGFIS